MDQRLCWSAAGAFLLVNGKRPTLTNDEAYDFVIAVATGEPSEVDESAEVLRRGTEDR